MNQLTLSIVPLYAAALTLLFIYLSIGVIKQRRLHRVAIGDGDKPSLKRAIGVHNNFAQYVPFTLLLLCMLEINRANTYVLHGLGCSLLVARIAHAYGVSQQPEPFRFRRFGMMTTFFVMAVAAIYLCFVVCFA